MYKTKLTYQLILHAVALLFTFSSCKKISEEIQRDMGITPAALSFTTPIIGNVITETTIGTVAANPDFDALIKSQDMQFSKADIQSIRVSEMKLEFTDPDKTNNLANFESLTVKIQADGLATLNIAVRTETANTESKSILLPLVNSAFDYRAYLTGTNLKYTVTALLRTATTKTLATTLTPRYLITVAK